jgi:hypothetical protein
MKRYGQVRHSNAFIPAGQSNVGSVCVIVRQFAQFGQTVNSNQQMSKDA